MLEFKDFWPGEHMFRAGLATIESQVKAANAWIASTPDIRVLNVETLIRVAGTVSGSSAFSNVDDAHGVRIWYVTATSAASVRPGSK